MHEFHIKIGEEKLKSSWLSPIYAWTQSKSKFNRYDTQLEVQLCILRKYKASRKRDRWFK